MIKKDKDSRRYQRSLFCFFFQAEDGIRDHCVTGVQTCALPISFAAIPDGAGEIHGCYDKQSGSLRVTDPQTNLPKSCSNKELPLDWAMRGIQGLDRKSVV